MHFNEMYCEGDLVYTDGTVVIEGGLKEQADNNEVYILAPAPPDRRQSFPGSGLPFSSEEQAYGNTPNNFRIALSPEGRFKTTIDFPNSYMDYSSGTGILVPPHFVILYTSGGIEKNSRIELGVGVPYRSIDYPPERTDRPDKFYAGGWNAPAMTQERILLRKGYPSSKM